MLFVKSFSKSLMPGLRIACLEAPAAMRERFAGVKRSIDISSNGLMQRVLDRFLSSGRLESHLVAARERYRSAFAAFAGEVLAGWTGVQLSATPIRNPADSARSAETASPWASNWWCSAGRYANGFLTPGA